MAMIHGNFSCLDRCEDGLYDLIVGEVRSGEDDDTTEIRDQVSTALVDNILATVLSPSVISPRASFLRGEIDVVSVCRPQLIQRFRTMIDLVLQRFDTQEEQGSTSSIPSFSSVIVPWGTDMIGSLIDQLCMCYRDGITSVQFIAQVAVSGVFSSLSPEAAFIVPIISSTLSSCIMKIYDKYKQSLLISQSSSGDGEVWLQMVPEEERPIWRSVIQSDTQERLKTPFVHNNR